MRKLIRELLGKALPERIGAHLSAARSRRHQVRLLRQQGLTQFAEAYIRDFGLQVRYGPFKGLIYSASAARDRILVCKLLGTYEMELHEIVEKVQHSSYDCVVDVGCAEGYYTTGFALTTTGTKIIAFDAAARELAFAHEMAETNGMTGKIEFRKWCSADELIRIAESHSRPFVLSDCEGYEIQLFDERSVRALRNSDVLIELHGDAESVLVPRFRGTHDVSLIAARSRDSIELPELTGVPPQERWKALTEYRGPQNWMFAKAKSVSPSLQQ